VGKLFDDILFPVFLIKYNNLGFKYKKINFILNFKYFPLNFNK